MKFSVRVLDVEGVKPPTEASRGPHHAAEPMLLSRSAAEAFYSSLSSTTTRVGVQAVLPLPAADPADAYSVWQGIYTRTAEVAPGEYLLVVTAKDKMPVFQRLTLAERNGVPTARAGWAQAGLAEANLQALSVELPEGSQGVDSEVSRRVLVVVKLHTPVEFVFVVGTSFWHRVPNPSQPNVEGPFDHTNFVKYARDRRNALFQEQQMLAGYRVTEFDLLGRRRRTWVKALGGYAAWLLVAETHTAKLALDYTVDRSAAQKDSDNIDVLDVYAYLDAIGKSAPGSVWSVEFFGHADKKAPILWDTTQREEYDDKPLRDPLDQDPRPKDFGDAVFSAYPDLFAAFLSKAIWRIWGCNVDRKILAAAVAAHAAIGPDLGDRNKVFKSKVGLDWEEQTTVAHLLASSAKLITKSYAAALLERLGQQVGCYSAAPGFGASLGTGMFITRKRDIVEGKSVGEGNDDLALARLYGLYRPFLSAGYLSAGIERADGYFEIRWLLEEIQGWPTPVWTPARYTWVRADSSWGLVCQTHFASGARCEFFGRQRVKPDVSEKTGLVEPGRKGWLFVFSFMKVAKASSGGGSLLKKADADVAFYQQDDGSLFVMQRSGGGWVVDTRPIPRTEGAPITNGLLVKNKAVF